MKSSPSLERTSKTYITSRRPGTAKENAQKNTAPPTKNFFSVFGSHFFNDNTESSTIPKKSESDSSKTVSVGSVKNILSNIACNFLSGSQESCTSKRLRKEASTSVCRLSDKKDIELLRSGKISNHEIKTNISRLPIRPSKERRPISSPIPSNKSILSVIGGRFFSSSKESDTVSKLESVTGRSSISEEKSKIMSKKNSQIMGNKERKKEDEGKNVEEKSSRPFKPSKSEITTRLPNNPSSSHNQTTEAPTKNILTSLGNYFLGSQHEAISENVSKRSRSEERATRLSQLQHKLAEKKAEVNKLKNEFASKEGNNNSEVKPKRLPASNKADEEGKVKTVMCGQSKCVEKGSNKHENKNQEKEKEKEREREKEKEREREKEKEREREKEKEREREREKEKEKEKDRDIDEEIKYWKKTSTDFRKFKSKYNSNVGNILRNWMSLLYCILILRMNLLKFVLNKVPDATPSETEMRNQILLEGQTMYNMIRKAQNFSQERSFFLWKKLEQLIDSRMVLKTAHDRLQNKKDNVKDWRAAEAKLSIVKAELEKARSQYKNCQKAREDEEEETKKKLAELESKGKSLNTEIEQMVELITDCKKREVQMRGKILVSMKKYKDLKTRRKYLMSVEKEMNDLKEEQNAIIKKYGDAVESLKSEIEEKERQIRAEREEKIRLKACLEAVGDFTDREALVAAAGN